MDGDLKVKKGKERRMKDFDEKDVLFAHEVSDAMNRCANLQQIAAMMACDHRYLVNEKFKLFVEFANVLALKYEQGDYDGRNEWACETAHKFAECYGGGERFTMWDDKIKENLSSAYSNLERYKPWVVRQEEDVRLVDRVMFALRDLVQLSDDYLVVVFGCIFGEDMGRHVFASHWNKEEPWCFWMALDDKNRERFLSFVKNKEGYYESARKKMRDSQLITNN